MPTSRPNSAYLAIGLYAVVLSVCVYFEFPWLALLPLAALFAWMAFARLHALILVLVAAVPLSINLEELELGGLGVYLPTEPLLAGLLVLFLFRSVRGWPVDARLLGHPFAWWIGLSILWLFLTTLVSSFPLVSFKFMVARLWFVVGFFFILGHFFLHLPKLRHQYVLAYVMPLCAVVIYTLVRHAGFGFEKDAGHWVMKPFYKDHTSYGAALAMVIPPMLALLTWKRFSAFIKAVLILALGTLVVGIVFSYTRAAWVSLAAAGVLWGLMKLGFRLRTLLTIGMLLIGFVWIAQDSLLIQLQRNDQDSSDDLTEHVESISNVSSDASNLERLNRWNAALAMFRERPLTGWGGGTYQFIYAPFQRAEDRTIISTNNADGGNAHSEYLGPLAEQGVLGLGFVIGMLGFCLHLGFRVQRRMQDNDERALAMGIFLGLMTYFIHGVLNNYLDTDKASALFWGFFALLVVWDLQSGQEKLEPAAT